jgi:transposase
MANVDVKMTINGKPYTEASVKSTVIDASKRSCLSRRSLLAGLATMPTLFVGADSRAAQTAANRFTRQRSVVAYVGLEPMERSSAERKRYIGISKAGSRLLRFLLEEAAHIAVRFDPELKQFHERIGKRRGKAKATVAVARKLLIRCWLMLRENVDYAEFRRRGVEARLARNDPRPSA